MADMGGTTSDLGILSGGRPKVSEIGATIGGWRTMVKAIDVTTIGLGGDSEVLASLSGELSVGPRRVVPISLIGAHYPEVISRLEREVAEPKPAAAAQFVMLPMGVGSDVMDTSALSARESETLTLVGERPKTVFEVAGSILGLCWS